MKAKLALLGIWVVCLGAGLISIVWMLVAIFAGSPRYWVIAKGIDRTGNGTSGGKDDEYLSARANRARLEGRRWGCLLCKLIAVFQPGHCESFDPPSPAAGPENA